MIAAQLINTSLPKLLASDTVAKAIDLMDDFNLTHLPLLKDSTYLGILSDTFLMEQDEDRQLETLADNLIQPYIFEDQHVLDAFTLVGSYKVSIVPVLNREKVYVGCISKSDLVNVITALTAIQQPGGIIILEMLPQDFTMTQIAQIVEGNNARILASYVTAQVGTNKIEVTLKINKEDLSSVLQTFNRYNYTVKSTFHESIDDEELHRRYEQFMKFINM